MPSEHFTFPKGNRNVVFGILGSFFSSRTFKVWNNHFIGFDLYIFLSRAFSLLFPFPPLLCMSLRFITCLSV